MKLGIMGLTVLCIMLMASVAFASPPQQADDSTLQPQSIQQQAVDEDSIAGMDDPDLIPLQRGCCSWHQGVCGCRNGRTVCCDGTLSPSCGC